MQKELWKKCVHCGTVTDCDEKECPKRGLENNPHELQVVELEWEEIKRLWKEGRIRTKNVADVEKKLLQSKDPP